MPVKTRFSPRTRPLRKAAACLLIIQILLPALLQAADSAKPADSPSNPTASKMSAPTNVTPAEAEALLHSDKNITVIDVRTQEEFAEGHIAGAKNVNFNSPAFLERMKEYEGKSILVHCAAGGRSARALEALPKGSFGEIFHLNKGFNAWVEAGKPVSTK